MTKCIENAIVIGATGSVGRELIRQLSQNETCKNITVVVRRRDQELDIDSPKYNNWYWKIFYY